MPHGDPERAALSAAEVAAAIRDLPEAGWHRLRKIARFRSRICPMEADDLLQTAFTRALSGERRCPAHVDVIRFLDEAMRSIASDSVKTAHRQEEAQSRRAGLRLVAPGDDETMDILTGPPPSPEAVLASEQEATRIKNAILRLFDDDLTAQTIIEGDMEEMEAEEIRALADLNKVEYATKRRFIRRRIDQAVSQRWKP